MIKLILSDENCIEWKNGSNIANPTFFTADNLNRVNTKTKEALTTLMSLLNLTEQTFGENKVYSVAGAVNAISAIQDSAGNKIDDTYATKTELEDVRNNLDVTLGGRVTDLEKANETLSSTVEEGNANLTIAIDNIVEELKPINSAIESLKTRSFISQETIYVKMKVAKTDYTNSSDQYIYSSSAVNLLSSQFSLKINKIVNWAETIQSYLHCRFNRYTSLKGAIYDQHVLYVNIDNVRNSFGDEGYPNTGGSPNPVYPYQILFQNVKYNKVLVATTTFNIVRGSSDGEATRDYVVYKFDQKDYDFEASTLNIIDFIYERL